ncbi:MAG: hypothetical protein KME26_23925 [Oscillatoria princeps RMCB-10]|jgi:hypothetical protein|nr:hypothetical protein [Oscillatoria princeps RMCB-10]
MHKPSISSKIPRGASRCAHRHPPAAPTAVPASAGAVRCKGLETFATPHSAGPALAEPGTKLPKLSPLEKATRSQTGLPHLRKVPPRLALEQVGISAGALVYPLLDYKSNTPMSY